MAALVSRQVGRSGKRIWSMYCYTWCGASMSTSSVTPLYFASQPPIGCPKSLTLFVTDLSMPPSPLRHTIDPDPSSQPPTKRRRCTDGADRAYLIQVGAVTAFELVAGPATHPYWFEDGDLVVGVEDALFRIHSVRIGACSRAFAEMFRGACPADIENVDGRPLIRLADSSKDWVVALDAIYDPVTFKSRHVVFDNLAGALRISTKYDIPFLREWAVSHLRRTWPVHLDQMGPMALPHAADAIALARECGLPDILPAAFYALSVQKWRAGTEGGHSHLLLSPADLRRLIAGREALQDILVNAIVDPLPRTTCPMAPVPPPHAHLHLPPGLSTIVAPVPIASALTQQHVSHNSPFCTTSPRGHSAGLDCGRLAVSVSPSPAPGFVFCNACRMRLEAFWRARLSPDAARPWGTWMLRELNRMAMVQRVEGAEGGGLALEDVCARCWEEHRSVALWRLDRLRDAIPRLFML